MELQRVLFLDTHTGTRAQIAATLLQNLTNGQISAFSAGPEEATTNPVAIQVLQALDISKASPSIALASILSTRLEQHFDLIITLCDGSTNMWPFSPSTSKRRLWALDNLISGPKDSPEYRSYQQTRKHLQRRITKELVASK